MQPDFNVYGFYQQMQQNKVILSFNGVVSQDLLSRLAASLKYKSLKDNTTIGRKIFAIFIELAQNVHLHSAEKAFSIKENRPIGIGFVLVSETPDAYIVSSSNLIVNEKRAHVIDRCNYINGLDPAGLKRFYKEQRRAPQRTESPGANIGLIDMVRKSNNPLDAQMFDYDSERSVFTLSVKINKHLNSWTRHGKFPHWRGKLYPNGRL